MHRRVHLLSKLLVACSVLGPALAVAQSAADAKKSEPKKAEAAAKPAEPAKPAIQTVKKAPLKIEVSLDGYFEARQMSEILLRPKAWATLEVIEAVEHGAQVKRGDKLVTLDLEKIDDAITAARNEKQLADVAISLAEADLKLLEGATPLQQAATESAHKRNDEDFARYYKITLPLTQKAAKYSLELAHEYLENQQEELRQLEKMYNADDLTEETEEIILKRQRSAVKRAEFMIERAKLDYEETLKTSLPRKDEDMKRSAQLENLQYQRAKTVLPLAMAKAKSELEKASLLQAKAAEKLAQLIADRELMDVTAPADGIVYYGRSVGGKFTGSTGQPLKLGDKLTAGQVFMTIVQPRPMSICVEVPESKIHSVAAKMKATAVPKGYPDIKAAAVVGEVAAIPAGEAKFNARLDVTLAKEAAAVMPGMTCSVKVLSYLNKAAITVPKTAVETDPIDAQKQSVYVVGKDGKATRQPVTVGRKTDKVIEIVKGLSVGDKIHTVPPKKD